MLGFISFRCAYFISFFVSNPIIYFGTPYPIFLFFFIAATHRFVGDFLRFHHILLFGECFSWNFCHIMEKYEVTVLITITFNGNNDNKWFEEMFIFSKGQQLSDYYLISHNRNSKYLYNILNLKRQYMLTILFYSRHIIL